MREGIKDGQLHRRHTHLGDDTAIDELDERMHHALRMDDDFYPIVREPEQKMGFDHLQRLVRERRAVDRDLPTHAPRWMPESVFDRRGCKTLLAPTAKRAARCGQDDTTDLRR